MSPDVLVGGSGATNLMAQRGQFISSLTISAPGFTFNAIEFNPFGLSASGILVVSALMSNGQTFRCPGPACSLTTFGGPGNNRITVLARDGERIESVTISSTGGPGTGFGDVRQVRFNQAEGGFQSTPEPGTLGLLGTGLIGLAGMMRRKLRNESTASKLKTAL